MCRRPAAQTCLSSCLSSWCWEASREQKDVRYNYSQSDSLTAPFFHMNKTGCSLNEGKEHKILFWQCMFYNNYGDVLCVSYLANYRYAYLQKYLVRTPSFPRNSRRRDSFISFTISSKSYGHICEWIKAMKYSNMKKTLLSVSHVHHVKYGLVV